MRRGFAAAVVIAALGAPATALGQSPPAGFTDWTSRTPEGAGGTLLGHPVTLAGNVGAASVLDGTSTTFASGLYTPSLATSDAPELLLQTAASFSLTFGAPMLDPVIHVSDLRSSWYFPLGTRAVKLSGDAAMIVQGHEVSFSGIDAVNGSFQLIGTFTSIPVQSVFTAGLVDVVHLQVGATPAPPPPPPPPALPAPPAPPAPIAGVSLVSQAIRGQVLIKPPGQTASVPLQAAASVPVGALVDARRGSLVLQSTVDGTVQAMIVAGGMFVVRQAAAGPPELRIATPPGRRRACASRRRGVVRRLTVTVPKGIVRTAPSKGLITGRDASWTSFDRCDGTLTRVTRGRVSVRHGRRTVTVRAGRSHLIKARLFAARRARGDRSSTGHVSANMSR